MITDAVQFIHPLNSRWAHIYLKYVIHCFEKKNKIKQQQPHAASLASTSA